MQPRRRRRRPRRRSRPPKRRPKRREGHIATAPPLATGSFRSAGLAARMQSKRRRPSPTKPRLRKTKRSAQKSESTRKRRKLMRNLNTKKARQEKAKKKEMGQK